MTPATLQARWRALQEATGVAAGDPAPSPSPGEPGAPPAGPPAAAASASGGKLHESEVAIPDWGAAPPAETMRRLAVLAREPAIARLSPEDLLFLDLETTGLSGGSGTMAFCFGLARLRRRAGGLVLDIRQRVLSVMADETLALAEARAAVDGAGAVVTFNGRSYDLPLLHARCVMRRQPVPRQPLHVDVLHPARRLLRARLPDVRLLSLERALWARDRLDDLPGAAIPAAFFAALRGDTALIDDVVRHNADDLATLAGLCPVLACLAGGGRAPTGLAADPLALAELRLVAGDREAALALVREAGPAAGAGGPDAGRAVRRARLARRSGGAAAAREFWRAASEAPDAGPGPWEELAKILEHHDRDPAGALPVVRRALETFGADGAIRARLEHRLARLHRKLARAAGFRQDGGSG